MEGFKECKFTVIPRGENSEVDALAILASMFQVPEDPKEHYQIEVKHKPSIPDNVRSTGSFICLLSLEI
jgi:hypothetical protein